ncbi:MAG: HBL/NHE enterotoxin family protein [Acidobacteriota bacterium]|nr:HBL/NHE enterotoxin family protein [Acidobacteriota bacterium]
MSVLALAPSSPDDVAREVTQMQEKLTAYWDAVNLITLNAHSITKQVLRKIDEKNPPAWWNDLSKHFQDCQSHAQNWIDTIYPSLTSIPQAIIDYNNYFEATSVRILKLLEEIGTKTPTAEQKAKLLSLLKLLSTKLESCRATIEQARTRIKTFTTNMANDHRELTTGSASVTKAIEENNKAVATLLAQIATLKMEIEQLNVQLIAALHGLAATMVVSYMMMSVTPYLAVPIAVIGVSVSLGFIIDAMVRISKKRDEIVAQSATLTKTEAQGVVLAAISSTVDAMLKSIQAIDKHIDLISSAWATLDVKMKSVIDSLKAATDEHWLDTLLQEIDIETARQAWKQLEVFAEKLQEVKLVDSDQIVSFEGVA